MLLPEAGLTDNCGRTALMKAAVKLNVAAVRLLVKFEAFFRDYNDNTALLLICSTTV